MARALPQLPKIDGRRLLLSLIVALAIVGVWFGLTRARTGESGLGTADPAIENVSPRPDELVLRQTQVVVDLAPGYRGELFIDDQQVPVVDGVNDGSGAVAGAVDAVFDPALNTITFTPTVGGTIEEFEPTTHRVITRFWRIDESPDEARSYAWSFRVQG